MRRLHRNARVRERLAALEDQGITEDMVDTNSDGQLSDDELAAAEEKARLQAAIDLVKSSGMRVIPYNAL